MLTRLQYYFDIYKSFLYISGSETGETPIPSEVWKLISMETGDDSQTVTQSSMDTDTTHNSMDTNTLTNVSQSINSDVTNSMNGDSSITDSYFMEDRPPSQSLNARNGLRGLSRNSSASSLASVSDLGRSTEREPLKLPEIDPTGSLVTQGASNKRNNSARSLPRTPVSFLKNSQSEGKVDSMGGMDSRLELLSLDGEIMSPHPPVEERAKGGNNKSRNDIPTTRQNNW